MKRVLFFLILINSSIYAQSTKDKKVLSAQRVSKAPKIDGELNDLAWKNANIATDFIEYAPYNGAEVSKEYQTKVKIVYDDNAIYISAMMYDPNVKEIQGELTKRDVYGQTDYFSLHLNTNNDGQNNVVFSVMNTGVQGDLMLNQKKWNGDWNAVWFSNVQMLKNGWAAEIKIPYSALRFPNQKEQLWGVNFSRRINAQNKVFYWNYVDNTKGFVPQYNGLLKGLKDISSPIRLSFYPYISTNGVLYQGDFDKKFNAGMDMKYGITKNFTLDLTLIPDFSQASFDKVELNLGPFEQRFSEQRQFFIEGTELFSKGYNLFYSRRIGGKPTGSEALKSKIKPDEKILKNPDKVNMLNAIKVSGRTKNGLGIGVFNAITRPTEATIETKDKKTYKITTEPYTNYNMIVLDQLFNKNSSVSIVNTSVIRAGHFRDANVSALEYSLRTPNNKYFMRGAFRTSLINEDNTYTSGYNMYVRLGKDSGNWNGDIGYVMEDDKYDINDMGFMFSNNEQFIFGRIVYKTLQPQGIFNFYKITSSFRLAYLYNPALYTGNRINISADFFTKERLFFNVKFISNFGYQYDYFEARKTVSERVFFRRNPAFLFNHGLSTDYRNKFALDYVLQGVFFQGEQKREYIMEISPRYRFSNRFTLIYTFNYSKLFDDRGYVTTQADDIIFGQRNINNIENALLGKYSFTVNTSLSLSFRHIWTTVDYQDQFYKLRSDGFLYPYSYTSNEDINYNSWNLDINYIWQINSGSQLVIFYRNNMFDQNKDSNLNFYENLEQLFKQSNKNILSVKFIYYLDYNEIKNIFNTSLI